MDRPRNALLWALLIALFAASTILAWRGPLPTWGDETFTLRLAHEGWEQFWSEVRLDVHPPLYFVISKLAAMPWAYHAMAPPGVRAVAYLIYLLSIGLPLWLLYRRMENRKSFFIAALLLATSAHIALFGPMLRYYALSGLGAVCATLLLLPDREGEKSAVQRAIWYGVALWLALWSSYLTAVILPAHIFYISRKSPSEGRPLRIAMDAVWVLSIPLAFLLLGQVITQTGVAGLPHLSAIVKGSIARLAFTLYSFSLGEFLRPWHVSVGIAMLSAVWLVVSAWKLRRTPLGGVLWLTFLSGALLGVLMLAVVGIGIEFTASRLLFLAPLLLILIGMAAASAKPGTINEWVTALALALLVSFNVLSTWNFHQGKEYIQSTYIIPWTQIARDITQRLTPDTVLLYDDDTLAYYLPSKPHDGFARNVNAVGEPGLVAQWLGNPPRVMVVFSPRNVLPGSRLEEVVNYYDANYRVEPQIGYLSEDETSLRWKSMLLGRTVEPLKKVLRVYVSAGG
jgi:hypothetical protein